jgi:hypothetical protein
VYLLPGEDIHGEKQAFPLMRKIMAVHVVQYLAFQFIYLFHDLYGTSRFIEKFILLIVL